MATLSIAIMQFKREEEELEKQVEASSGQLSGITSTSSTASKVDKSTKASSAATSLGAAGDVLDVEGTESCMCSMCNAIYTLQTLYMVHRHKMSIVLHTRHLFCFLHLYLCCVHAS